MKLRLWIVCVMAGGMAIVGWPALAQEQKLVVNDPLVQVSRMDGLEACAFPAVAYHGLEVAGNTARFTLDSAVASAAGSQRVLGKGIRCVNWEPAEDGMAVEIEFATAPEFYVVNTVPSTNSRPDVPQVVAAFSFPASIDRNAYPVMGTGVGGERQERGDEYGNYDLPGFPKVKYSDALVTLNVRNTDFREVLWLLSEIGGVSIMLDPYWNDEPTGTRRAPGGGASGDGGGNSGSGGFRGAGVFTPPVPREGTGNLSLNFVDVPFDTALELVLMAVDLVKVDYYPVNA